MKKLLSIVTLVFCAFLAIGQNAPQMFNYQGVARDNGGNVLANQAIGLQIGILSGSNVGPVVFEETHNVTTNNFGLFNILIGSGTAVTGAMSDIDWGSEAHWVKVALDASGGTSYTEMGTSQLLSVPYALYANSSSGSLDDAYRNGRTVNATDGAVKIEGEDGLLVTGTVGIGDTIEVAGSGARMLFNPNMGALRAGNATGSEWDNGNVGLFSTATGYGTQASEIGTVAMGFNTTATGQCAIAMGQNTEASGLFSAAMGYNTNATGDYSIAMGNSSNASANGAVSFGISNLATGAYSTATGVACTASGSGSVAMGESVEASGDKSFAAGFLTTASGNNSTAFGEGATASGTKSTAFGQNTTASGTASTAFGKNAIASGRYSTSFGLGTTASGDRSTAFGELSVASGEWSTAFVSGTASGQFSTAIGYGANAPSAEEIVIGSHNTLYTPVNTNIWNSADRLFVVGNGTSSSSRSDALVMLKNGNIGIGESNPTQLLHLSGESGVDGIKFPDGTEQTTAYTGAGGTTLDAAYDQGGAGAGRTIDASDGAVFIDGTDGLIVTGNTGIGTTAPTAKLHVADGNVVFDRNTDGTAGTRNLTISGKRSGNGLSFAGIEFRNQDILVEYLGSAIRAFNSNGFETGDLRFYVRDDDSNPMTEGLRITHNAEVYVPEADAGIIMKSPDGNCWRMTVSNAGAPVFTSVACP